MTPEAVAVVPSCLLANLSDERVSSFTTRPPLGVTKRKMNIVKIKVRLGGDCANTFDYNYTEKLKVALK